MAEHAGEKTQDPTPHRRQQAREQGQVARSQDLVAALLLLGGLLALYLVGGPVAGFVIRTAAQQWGSDVGFATDAATVAANWRDLVVPLAAVLLPLLGLIMLVAVAGNVVQVGVAFQPERVAPDLSRLDPLAGLARLFSTTNASRLPLGVLKLSVVAATAWFSVSARQEEIFACGRLAVPELSILFADLLFGTALRIGVALLALAVLDYGYQRWRLERDLRMTSQEMREELRNLEGAPQVVARRKSMRRQLAGHRPVASVPTADVLVTGPTGHAVALRYDPETMAAPIVVAKGAGQIAERLCSLAAEHGVATVDEGQLAHTLYKSVEVNRPVPQHLFADVAGVLAGVLAGRADAVS